VIGTEFGLKFTGLDYDLGKMISIGFNGILGIVMFIIIRKKPK